MLQAMGRVPGQGVVHLYGGVNWTEYAPVGDREHAVFSVAAN